MFGAIFLLAQFFQTVQGYSPLASGVRILPWTVMPMFVAPIAGALSDRIGGHKIIGVGLALQAVGLAWIAAVSAPTTPYIDLVGPFTISGIGADLGDLLAVDLDCQHAVEQQIEVVAGVTLLHQGLVGLEPPALRRRAAHELARELPLERALGLGHEGLRLLFAPGGAIAVGAPSPGLEVDRSRLLDERALAVVDPVPREGARSHELVLG